jgi:hypothetical protein
MMNAECGMKTKCFSFHLAFIIPHSAFPRALAARFARMLDCAVGLQSVFGLVKAAREEGFRF